MAEFYFFLLVLLASFLFLNIFLDPSKVYEYPYFLGSMFLVFVVPQAISLISNPTLAPDGSVPPTILMSFLCLSMACLGYYLCPPVSVTSFLACKNDHRILFRVALVFLAGGYFFLFLINREAGGNSGGGGWTGMLTIYYMLYQVIYIAFPLLLLLSLKFKKRYYIIAAIIAALPILQLMIFYGRREATTLFFLTLALSFFFIKGTLIPRLLILGGLVFTLVFIPLIGSYREHSEEDPLKALLSMNLKEDFVRYYAEGKDLEITLAAHMIDATNFYGNYDLGADYWNEMVFRYFPGQLFGKELKTSLMVGSHGIDKFFRPYDPLNGLTTTCMGDAYRHFNYLGSVFYFLLGGFFRALWTKSKQGHLAIQVFYIVCMVQALLSVSHGTVNFLPGIFHLFIFLMIAIFFSKTR